MSQSIHTSDYELSLLEHRLDSDLVTDFYVEGSNRMYEKRLLLEPLHDINDLFHSVELRRKEFNRCNCVQTPPPPNPLCIQVV